jgi:hypothetical protein
LTAHPASAAPGPIRRGARRLGRLPGRTTRAMLRGWP